MFSDSSNDSPDNIIPNEDDEIDNINADDNKSDFSYYPVIPLREQVIFPGTECSFYIGREDTLASLSHSIEFTDKQIFLANQKDSDQENPSIDDLYPVGVLASILNVHSDKDKNVCCVTVRAFKRAEIWNSRKIDRIQTVIVRSRIDYFDETNEEQSLLLNNIIKDFSKYCHIEQLSTNIIQKISNISKMEELINTLACNVKMPYESQIQLLQESDTLKRLALLETTLQANIEIFMLQKKIVMDIKKDNDKQQKEFFLHEQIKSLQKELLTLKDDPDSIMDDEEKFAEYVEKLGMNEQAKEKALSDAKKLRSLPTISPDAGILRNYIDWLIKLPWTNKSQELLDYKISEAILNEEHYGLRKVKQRIMEFIAVRNLNQTIRGPILCFVGPPGIGKTSLSRSVANALGREFIRISLGGVRDEAEIRGHRRTYLGALPGKIIQSMRKVKTINPVFLLDEIDKMTSDMRGDPASAL
ncbi:MAG: LON peptidase substrate-binding domain-containing protein, partial [Spirochaetales bacterium]|nr:LON peptidase substrate-binding domain-containing protein [Spirochaetales bacterium]